ncbi:hypothetical protein [Flexilinea flocculi]|uniref:Uncharacterized protein n=1 Tax=Flexilinea flocculi TaxID=1678840 RepID=A0A0S7BRW2_9CHLR|nr:hypothetical protein [Flexilinea flocculi]GAP40430.1 hypothetical protein ATC1_13405 [Flexilinea flocculi]
MFRKKRELFYFISLFFISAVFSINVFFSSIFWNNHSLLEKILQGFACLFLFLTAIFFIQKIAAPLFLKCRFHKNFFRILFPCILLFSVAITWSDLSFFPHALQPRNSLRILYQPSESIVHPTFSIFPFNKTNDPEIFNGTKDGIPGFANLKEINGQLLLEGSTNFRGYAVLDIPLKTKEYIINIRWNDKTVDFSNTNHLILPASKQLFAGQSCAIRFIFFLLLISRLCTHALILGMVITSMYILIWLLTSGQMTGLFRNWQWLYLILAGLLLLSPQFSYHIAEKVLFFIWTILCSVLLKQWKEKTDDGKYHTRKIHFLLIITAFGLSFLFFGNRTLVLTQTSTLLPAANILFFFSAALWLLPSIFCFLYFMELLSEKAKKSENREKSLWIWFEFFGLFILIFTLYLIAYNPAISSMDSQGQWWQAIGETPIDDAHTPFHTLYLRYLIRIIPSPLFIAMLQILLFAGIGSSFLTWLYKRGIPKYLLLIFILQFSAVPNNGLSVITIWKDIPYGISLLWLTLVLSEIISGQQICHSKRITIPEITVCLLCVCLFRYNGMLPGIAAGVYLLITGIRRRNRRLMISVILSGLLYWIITGPVYRSLPVVHLDFGKNTLDRVMVNDMIGVERIGGTLPTATSQLLDRITGNYREVPYSHYEIDNTWNQIANWSDIDMGTILKSYGRTFISNPVHLLRTILLRTEFVWAVKQIPSGGFIDSVIWNDADIYGYERIITPLKGVWDTLCRISIRNPFFIFIWRIGIDIGLIIVACIYLVANRRCRLFWAALPFWMNLLSLAGVTFPTYRYLWPNEVITGFLLLSFIVQAGKNAEK